MPDVPDVLGSISKISHAVVVTADMVSRLTGSNVPFNLVKAHNLRCVKADQLVLIAHGLDQLTEAGYLHVIGKALFKGNQAEDPINGKKTFTWLFEVVDLLQGDIRLGCNSVAEDWFWAPGFLGGLGGLWHPTGPRMCVEDAPWYPWILWGLPRPANMKPGS